MYSRYPSVRDAFLTNDNDLVSLGGHRRFRVSILDGGPNDNGHVALIPQASVISATPQPRETVTVLSYGRAIHVPGFGCLRIVNSGNRDWPRLVPVDGDRYYSEYAGGPGWLHWEIRDSQNDGERVLQADRDQAAMMLFDRTRIKSRAEANAVAAFLSAQCQSND